jgi:histone arginine demethylase JMJD6
LKKEDFWSKYEAKDIPCVIRSIPAGYDGGAKTKQWGAITKWTLDALRDSHLRKRLFKCGEDDDGNTIRVKLSHFLKYVDKNYDDSPLYIFDSTFDEDGSAKDLLRDYKVPSYFADDLFGLVSEARRAPYRWFLVGPERSGSCVHIDPLATNAWNALILGKKRWVLFPPHVPKYVVKGRGLVRKDEDDEAIHYFMNILPRIKRRATALKEHEDYRDFACYEFTQNAGETVFIPQGWWHAVLNLTDTVGVTQNFCSPRNFDSVWLKTRTGRKRMAWKWLCQLDEHYPHLADRARKLNKRDHFRMKYDPVEVKRGEEYREHMRKMRKVV